MFTENPTPTLNKILHQWDQLTLSLIDCHINSYKWREMSLLCGLSMNLVLFPPSSTRLRRTLTLNVTRWLAGWHNTNKNDHCSSLGHNTRAALFCCSPQIQSLFTVIVISSSDRIKWYDERQLTIQLFQFSPNFSKHPGLTPSWCLEWKSKKSNSFGIIWFSCKQQCKAEQDQH